MIIQSTNFSLKLEEFLKEDISKAHFNQTEKNVFRLVKDWNSGKEYFNFQTSGSTGSTKTIPISREKIIYSTHATFGLIDPENAIKSALLCLDPGFIGGAMVIFRALIKGLNLTISEPSLSLDKMPATSTIDLVSMVPSQYQSTSVSVLERFKTILIGGAAIGIEASSPSPHVYSTYGMTETISHIALRRIDSSLFTTTGDTEVRADQDGALSFRGTITDHQWLNTNDIGEVLTNHSFHWMGRKDFVINTGGVKVHPEKIEQKLSGSIRGKFMITSLPDPLFGEKVVLVMEDKQSSSLDFSILDKYEIPKAIFYERQLYQTESGKIDRMKTRKSLIASL